MIVVMPSVPPFVTCDLWGYKMTDKAMLDLAAKAYGIELEWQEEAAGKFPAYKHGDAYVLWNPLLDDGDAFRLAVRCLPFHVLSYTREDYEACNEDGRAATRRAIVRLAAEQEARMP